MIKNTLLAGAALLVLNATAAQADDYNYKKWGDPLTSGLYGGVAAGYTWGDDGAGFGIDPNGWEGGVFGGYRYGFGPQFALGAEVGFDFVNNVEESLGGVRIDKRNSYYVAAQPVFTLARDWNIFGTVGWQQAQYKASAPGGVDTETYSGIRYGGGVEYAYMQHTGIRLEAVQVDYEEKGLLEPEETNVRAGVFYKF